MAVDSLRFFAAVGQPDPPPQSLRIVADSVWQATASANWIVLSTAGDSGDAVLSVSIRPLMLVGTVSDTIYLSSRRRRVSVTIHLQRTGTPPHGLLYGFPNPSASDAADSIMVAQPDGTGATRLRLRSASDTAEWWPISGPVVSPVESRFAFAANIVGSLGDRTPQVFVARADGTVFSWASAICGSRSTLSARWAATMGWSPDGTKLAFHCVVPGPQILIIHDVSADTSVTVTLPTSFSWSAVGAVAWSPDGTWILDGTNLVSADRARADITLPLPSGQTGLGWTPDNRIIIGAAGICGTGVSLMRPYSRAPLLSFLPSPYRYATMSPDNARVLAITSACTAGDVPAVRLLDRANLKEEWFVSAANWAAWRP